MKFLDEEEEVEKQDVVDDLTPKEDKWVFWELDF